MSPSTSPCAPPSVSPSKETRTFCHLEDTRMLESGDVGTGPLVAINEVSVKGGEGVDEGDEETGSTKAM